MKPPSAPAAPTSGRFRVVVVDSYYAALQAAKFHDALHPGENALGVVAAKEADGSWSFQGTDAGDSVKNLRRVEGAAVLFVPKETLRLLESDGELWARVENVEHR